jgi:hypothetical protein
MLCYKRKMNTCACTFATKKYSRLINSSFFLDIKIEIHNFFLL